MLPYPLLLTLTSRRPDADTPWWVIVARIRAVLGQPPGQSPPGVAGRMLPAWPIALPAVGARAGAAAGEIEGTPGASPAMKKGPE
jgi:hypothetical protein